MADFKMMHPFVQIEASREKRVVTLRGPPEDVKRCQHDLLTFVLQKETRILIGRESSLIVGKGGATINRLVETHKVVIDVTETGEDVFTCTIAGPSVDSAVAEIDSILNANKEVTESIHVDAIMRNTLLTDSGAPIKQLQKTVNDAVKEIAGGGIQLNFSKEDRSILVIKGRHVAMETARKIINDFLEKVQSSLVTIDVDPFAISQLIGKGGETIKKIKGDGVVNIEVDKALGRVTIQSQDDEEVKRVESAIKSILESNNVVRIPASCARLVFRELLRNDKKNEINAKVWMGLDEDTSTIVLRGTRENVSFTLHVYRP
jgi:polyribonucleotide nucleotidyltransferase